jgi:hypothetical protein
MHFESIDAAIFSGDEFLNPEAIKEARQYLDRWQRELTAHAQFCFEEKCIRHRIACKSYPMKEALYPDIESFEKDTGLKFKEQS